MNEKVQKMLQLTKWAVLGASSNHNKFGYRIYKLLKSYGYQVYPVNPKETMIDGERCFNSLRELPIVPDVVDFVVPPSVAMEALMECVELGIKNVWLQPGVNTPEVVAKAQVLGFTVISDTCAMVESSKPVMLKKKYWAVISTSTRQAHQAVSISAHLQHKGHTVSIIKPEVLQGTNTLNTDFLASLLHKPEVVIVVGPSTLTEGVLRACEKAKIDFIWLQPGSESDEVIALGNSLNLIMVHHASVINEMG